MIEKSAKEVFDKVKLQFFRKVFDLVGENDGSLSAQEAFSLEIIHLLHEPTISQFADFLKISQSNATYKINALTRKGYIVRQNSEKDRREYHLILSEKFYHYVSQLTSYERPLMQRLYERFSEEELATLDHMFQVISEELMEESKESSSGE